MDRNDRSRWAGIRTHIQWHNVGGPDIEANGLALCALHHKLFDLGAFTIESNEHRVVFSQFAVSNARGLTGGLEFHCQPIHRPQSSDQTPGPMFFQWNVANVFKKPGRVFESQGRAKDFDSKG